MASRCANARKSPEAALFTSCFREASSLVIFVRRPFSLISTFSRSVLIRMVTTLRLPLGLPAGLPDCPGRNRDFDGGFPYPTSPSLSLSLLSLIISSPESQQRKALTVPRVLFCPYSLATVGWRDRRRTDRTRLHNRYDLPAQQRSVSFQF